MIPAADRTFAKRLTAAVSLLASQNRYDAFKSSRGSEVLLAHPGTQHSFRLAEQLHRHRRLASFHTSLAVGSDLVASSGVGILPNWAYRLLQNRTLSSVPKEKVKIYPLEEALRFFREKCNARSSEMALHRRNRRFQELIPQSTIQSARAVIGFDTSSWILAKRCRALGVPFILDQSIGHPSEKETMLSSLRKRYPGWTHTIPKKLPKYVTEERDEHVLADLIVVPSNFVKKTLISQDTETAKIRIIPFGTDLNLFRPASESKYRTSVIFLFAGALSVRKGLPVLLEAWRTTPPLNAELWLVGPGQIPKGEIEALPDSVKILGPKSRLELAELMRQADAFVFPSYFEGLAQVLVEAAASGLPTISTHEAGASDLIRDGENGFLVEAGDALALASRLHQLAGDADLAARMRQNVLASRELLSWSVYGDRWSSLLDEIG
jgi:alpha-maltose-1-phosphate synthase